MFNKKKEEITILLDHEDFKCLVRGGILTAGIVRLALQDIGFDYMDEALSLAEQKIDIYKDRTKY